ncbi:uncharacterized mitochondrial protein-like protein [Tanacetum coccineum]
MACLPCLSVSQEEPHKFSQALADEQWIERCKKNLASIQATRDERGTIIKNKARLVAQGYRQEEGVDYDEMDVKSAFCMATSHKRFWKTSMHKELSKMSSMGELTFFLGLQVKQSNGGIFLSQDKYVKDILNKFDFRTIKPASTPIEAHKSLGKDEEGEDVDISSHPKGSSSYMLQKKSLVLMLGGTTMIESPLQEDVNILAEDYFLAMQETNKCAISYRSIICSICKLFCGSGSGFIHDEGIALSSQASKFSTGMLQGTPTQSAAHSPKCSSLLKEFAELQWTADFQGPLNFEEEAGPSSPLRPIQVMDSEEQHNAAEVLVSISRPRGLSIPGPIQSQPQQPTQGTDTQGTDPKDKGKGILVEEPKKKKLTLQQIRALETTNDEEVARKIQAEWDAEEERKRFEELKKTKPKTTLRKPTSLAQERNQMMSFLKGQGYKNLQKLKYPQMKELYDKVQASIKDSFKDFVPMDSEKEREMLKERDVQRLSRKRKATITEVQPSKKPKLRSETIDELRNYLRVVDCENNATR